MDQQGQEQGEVECNERVNLLDENRGTTELYTGDGSVNVNGDPVLKQGTGNWKACPFILGNECCERLAYYGIATNLVTYLTKNLHQGNSVAARNVTTWSGTCYVTPLIGAFLADTYWGRYKTIAVFSIIYFFGMFILTLSASIPFLKPQPCLEMGSDCTEANFSQYAVFFIGLYLIAFGTGGIKPCVSSFGADQFDDTDPIEKVKKGSFFNWFYFSINIGALISSSFLVYVQDNYGWAIGFGIPTLFMGLAVVSFFSGTSLYRFQRPRGSPLIRICQVMTASIRKWNVNVPHDSSVLYELEEKSSIGGNRKLEHSDEMKFLDKAATITDLHGIDENFSDPWNLCTVTQVEELKILVRMFPIWATGIVFSAVYAQMTTMFVEQGMVLDAKIGSFIIPPASLSTFDVISVIIWVPMYDRFLVPIVRKFTGNQRGFTQLQRMGIGLFISILSMVAAAILEIKRLEMAASEGLVNENVPVPINIFWQKKKLYTFKRSMRKGDGGRVSMVRLRGGGGIPFMKFFLAGTSVTTITLQFFRPDLLPSPIGAGFDSVIRSSRALHTIGFVAVDYRYSLRGMDTSSDEYRSTLAEVNLRSAKRILKLCEVNRGFYVKAGQYFSSIRQIPKEYSSLLSSLQDQALPCNFKDVKRVLMKNLGKDMSQIFLMFDEEPIAAASIAQVHHAVLLDNHEVAVKVQYPGLEQRMKIDIITMTILSKLVAWVFPDYRFECVVSEFKKSISLELDFIKEAQNSERTAMNFKENNMIMVPQVFWELTSKQVLTMQFCKGYKVDDLNFYKKSGINPVKIAKALMDLFAEMIFIHGFVHGDPHPGNVLVCPQGHNDFCMVILDHGIYKELDAKFRLDYCQLWKALILLDSQKIHQLGKNFGVAKYAKYFPVIFTGRTINSKSALGSQLSAEERAILKKDLKSLNMNDISQFMESLSSDFLAVLRTDGLLRSTTSKLGAPQQLRLLAYAKHAVYGLDKESSLENQGYKIRSVISRSRANISYLQLIIFLKMLDLLSRFEQLRRKLFKTINLMFLLLFGEDKTSNYLI